MQSKLKDWLRKTNPRKKRHSGKNQGSTTPKVFIPRQEAIGSTPAFGPPERYDTDRDAASERSAGSDSNDGSRSGFSPTHSKDILRRRNTGQSRQRDSHRASFTSYNSRGSDGGAAGSNHSKITSLGGDPKLMTHGSFKKYSEDIADRNIEENRLGLYSSRNSSSLNLDAAENPGELPSLQRKVPTRRSSLHGSTSGASLAEILYEVEHDSGEEPGAHERYKPGRAKFPARQPRDESKIMWRRRRSSSDSIDDTAPRPGDFGPRVERPDVTGRRGSSVISDADYGSLLRQMGRPSDKSALHGGGVADLKYSENVDGTTQWLPGTFTLLSYLPSRYPSSDNRLILAAVTREHIVRPTERYITEQIHRDIHTHEYYHHIQRVIDTEVLPPKHYIPNPDDPSQLIEVSPSNIPADHKYEQWYIGNTEIERPSSDGPTGSAHASTDAEPESLSEAAASPNPRSNRKKPLRKPLPNTPETNADMMTPFSPGHKAASSHIDSVMMSSPTTLSRFTSRDSDSEYSDDIYVDASESSKQPLSLREMLDSLPQVDGCSDDDGDEVCMDMSSVSQRMTSLRA